MWKFLLQISCALSVTAFLSMYVGSTLPIHWGNFIGGMKFIHLAHNPRSYQVIFWGDSRTRNHVDAFLFENEVRETLEINAYNAGIPAVQPLEMQRYMKVLIEDHDLRARYMLVPVKPLRLFTNPTSAMLRKYYWYTTEFFATHFEYMLKSSPGLLNTSHLFVSMHALLNNTLNINKIDYFTRYAESIHRQVYDISRGFEPLDTADAENISNLFLKKKYYEFHHDGGYALMLDKVKRHTEHVCDTSLSKDEEQLVNIYRELSALGREHDITMIFFAPVVAYSIRTQCLLSHISSDHHLPPLLLDNAPGLYEQHMFAYKHHLNKDGAELYTKLLAEQFAKFIKTHKETPTGMHR